ncbi:hypothetical protein AVEN_194563-1 [Araneus ventricosus]|uniref:Uncharacterized protein n=1 Tax=Araneus ventricosus TaxID=182803 RepID=A0A4Y2A7R9_ARAVE|nr:hypothetical protein AVEN_194563-1 [Araneus ventricosus]
MDCGRWFGKSLGSVRVNGCTDAIWPLQPPSTCELFTTITRETTDALTSPRTTSILPVPTTRNNTNRGRNSWKDRPWVRSLNLIYCHVQNVRVLVWVEV